MNRLKSYLPILVVLGFIILLGYPLALVFGLPLALRDMRDLRKWDKETIMAAPLADVNTSSYVGTEAVASPPIFTELTFARVPEQGVLVKNQQVISRQYQADGATVTYASQNPVTPVSWQATLEPLNSRVYSFGKAIPETDIMRAIYVGNHFVQEGAVRARELPDGQRTEFHFRIAEGAVLVDGQLLREGEDYQASGHQVTFERAPDFGSAVRRISRDYAVLSAAEGTLAFNEPPAGAVRAAANVLRLAEVLSGEVDGHNRRFRFARGKVVEDDDHRAVFVGDRQLTGVDERAAERVDGQRTVFTFDSEHGIVTVNGEVMLEPQDYTRVGKVVTFTKPPPRNARLRQYRNFYLVDPATGEILLSEAPQAGDVVWAGQYTVYAQPSCGQTVLECFFALPQHPVPFPHWIAQGVVPFFAKYPLTDERNVVRATLYTTLGTLSALALGGAVGIMLAVLFVLFRPLERALLPWTVASQTVPIIALVPVLLLILGNVGITIQTSLLPTAIIGAYIAFFPVVVGTVKGLRSVDPLAFDLMSSYAATPQQIFVKLRFPAAVPFFFTSLKLGAAAALVGALVAEVESNNSRGLGYQILGQVQSGNVTDVWILLLVSGLLGIGLVALIGLLQRLVAPWERP